MANILSVCQIFAVPKFIDVYGREPNTPIKTACLYWGEGSKENLIGVKNFMKFYSRFVNILRFWKKNSKNASTGGGQGLAPPAPPTSWNHVCLKLSAFQHMQKYNQLTVQTVWCWSLDLCCNKAHRCLWNQKSHSEQFVSMTAEKLKAQKDFGQ